MQKTLPNGKWRKRLKIKALPPFAELHRVRAENCKIIYPIITLSDDAVEHHRRTISLFLQFLFHNGYVSEDYSRNMPAKRLLRKNPLPSVWEREDVDKLLSAVDRANPMGKRDYAILLLVTKPGLRVGDIRTLCLGDIDWENSRLSFTQSKTQKRIDLPLPNDVGWAIIDSLQIRTAQDRNSEYFLDRPDSYHGLFRHVLSERHYCSVCSDGKD